MMDLFIYLQLGPIEQIRFTHPVQEWVKINCPVTTRFDADNHSDSIVINYGLEQIKESKSICVLIEAKPNQKLGGITSLIEKIVRKKDKSIIIFFNGENEMIEKMLSFSKDQVYNDLTDLKIMNEIKLSFQ